MERVEKVLPKAADRFVPKEEHTGKKVRWVVYDKARASTPLRLPGLGKVRHAHDDREQCEAECQRLASFFAKE